MNLTFQMVTFRVFMFSILFCHEAFLFSKPKCAVLKLEMCRFQIRKRCQLQIRKSVHFKYENPAFSKKRKCHFQIPKMRLFQI